MEKRLSLIFGLLIGAMWMGEVLLGNLGGTSIFGNLRDFHPRVYALGACCAWSAVGLTGIGGFVAAHRSSSIGLGVRVGIWGGLISGAITFVTLVTVVVLFHDAMMKDPSNVHEFARGAHHAPSE